MFFVVVVGVEVFVVFTVVVIAVLAIVDVFIDVAVVVTVDHKEGIVIDNLR